MSRKIIPLVWLFLSIIVVSSSCRFFTHEKSVGYINNLGNYGYNFPSTWKGYVTGTDVHYDIEGTKLDIVVEPALPEFTFDTILSEIDRNSIEVNIAYLTVDGEQAMRQDVLGINGDIKSRIYNVFHNNYKYTIMIMFDEGQQSQLLKEHLKLLDQFEGLVQSFRFLSPE